MPSKILIVDDIPANALLLASKLPSTYEFEMAHSAEAALQAVSKAQPPFALIFTDVEMPPGMNGIDMVAELRRRGIEVPVIVNSSNAKYGGMLLPEVHGKCDFITKPFSPADVVGQIEALLAPDPSQKTVLIAEDDYIIRSNLLDALKNAGYRVLEAASKADAITLFKQHKGEIGTVITDNDMEAKGAGLELISELRKGNFTGPILMVSGGDIDTSLSRSVAALPGNNSFIPKPYRLEEIITAVGKPAAQTKRHKVLVVDDSRLTLRLYEAVLNNAFDVDVVKAASAQEARQAIADAAQSPAPFDLMINAVGMAEDGIDMVAQLRRQGITTPVIFNSADLDHADRLSDAVHGDHSFLLKPVTPPMLEAQVYKMLPKIAERTPGLPGFR